MFNFYSLSSSSSGNCYLIKSDNINILVDVGISMKRINQELATLNLSLSDINSILITHEHTDHCKSLNMISKNYQIPIYINKLTFKALKENENILRSNVHYITAEEQFEIGDLKIKAFEISHDAVCPYGYTIKKGKKKISIATDMGIVTDNVIKALSNSCFAFIESNYDINMLNSGKYPYPIKRRIASNTGHLSNLQCSEIIGKLINKNTTNFMLGHLSKENNFPDLALETIKSELVANKIDTKGINISVANHSCISNLINLE